MTFLPNEQENETVFLLYWKISQSDENCVGVPGSHMLTSVSWKAWNLSHLLTVRLSAVALCNWVSYANNIIYLFIFYEGWNCNSGDYLFTTDTK